MAEQKKKTMPARASKAGKARKPHYSNERKVNGGITRAQKKLVDEIIASPTENKGTVYRKHIDPDATPSTASLAAERWLGDPRVQKYYDQQARDLMERTKIRQDDVLRELAALALFDIKVLFDENGVIKPIDQWPSFASRAIASFNVKELRNRDGEIHGRDITFKMWDKVRALELLGKHLRLFTDQSTAVTEDGKEEIIRHIKSLQKEMQERGLQIPAGPNG